MAYNESSKRTDEITTDNWMHVLLKKDVSFGRPDENLVPCGYRTLMVWQLAEKYSGKVGLFDSLNSIGNKIYPKLYDLASSILA
ncbi:hypothetical protein M1N05_03070, partial [Dehalococcoidales bacterium]|nr:hypothetical protein [Dehalococcoidales bacterium]